jgi:sulfopyruvate decarboxylase subunit alpha
MSLPRTASRAPLWASGVAAGVYATGSRHVVYVPDNPLACVLAAFRDAYPDIRTTIATREEEAFGIAAGLALGGARPTVMLQSSGLGNSLNALTSLLLPYEIPVLVVVSMRGDAGEWNAAQEPMGRAVRPILDAIGVPHLTADSPEATAEVVRRASDAALGGSRPAACLLPRRLTQALGPGTSDAGPGQVDRGSRTLDPGPGTSDPR